MQEMNPLYSKIEQSILSLSSSQMKEVEEFLSKLQSDSTPTMTPAVPIEPALAVPPSPLTQQSQMDQTQMAPQIQDSGGMNQQVQGTQMPQTKEQSLPDMSSFGGMSQQGLQTPELSMPQVNEQQQQQNVQFHVSPELDYIYRDVFNVYVGVGEVVIEFGNLHRSMPTHATIGNRIVMSVGNAYTLIQTMQQALQEAQIKLQRNLQEQGD